MRSRSVRYLAVAVLVLAGVVLSLGLAPARAWAQEAAVSAVTNPSGDGKTYTLSPIRVTYGVEPIDLASAITEAAQADSVDIDLSGATYASSRERVATVSDQGVVTIENVGITTITVTLAHDAGTVSALIDVNPQSLTNNPEAQIAPIPEQTYEGQPVRPPLTVTVGEKTLVEGVDYTASYVNNRSAGTATAVANGLGNYTGNVRTTFEIVGEGEPAGPDTPSTPDHPELQRVYRLYNPYSGWHLYTASLTEYNDLCAIGWQGEGVAWYAPLTGPDIYRLYNPYTGWHFYTESVHEFTVLQSLGWQGEGVSFHSAPSTGLPVYRLYNPYTGWHLFTTNRTEDDDLAAIGWQPEGIAWYGERVSGAPLNPAS